MEKQETRGLLHFKRVSNGWSPSPVRPSHLPDWPTKTDRHCLWCCHPFDTVPIPLPLSYDDRTDVFKVYGMFCSWSCAKTYNMNTNHPDMPYRGHLLSQLYKRTTGITEGINPAPSKNYLKIFGGDMDIEDFRNTFSTQLCNRPLLSYLDLVDGCRVHKLLEGGSTFDSLKPSTEIAPNKLKKLNFDNVSGNKNETLRLKRTKPLPNKSSNILEKVLGLRPTVGGGD